MKKILIILLPILALKINAQTNLVGINTTAPTARLEIVSKTTNDNLRFRNADATTVPLLVQDGGNVGILNNISPIAPLDVNVQNRIAYSLCAGLNFVINSSTNHRIGWGGNYTNGASSCNHGNTLFNGTMGVNGPGSSVIPSQAIMMTNDNADTDTGGGFYIAPHSDGGTQPNAGLYMRENGLNTFSVPPGTAPKTSVDINGSLMIGANGYTDTTSATGKKCLKAGEMIYLKHFYVCGGSPLEWKQVDN